MAAQVQWLTMSTAMRPVLIVRPHVLKSSELFLAPPYLRSSHTMPVTSEEVSPCNVGLLQRRAYIKIADLKQNAEATVPSEGGAYMEPRITLGYKSEYHSKATDLQL